MKTNISQQKKEKILEKCSIIKDFLSIHSRDPELIRYISEIEQEINKKTFGLRFERHSETFDEQPDPGEFVLSEIPDLSITGRGQNENYLIEGENLAILKWMMKEYAEKIDVICIDPPYNTGNATLKYNDSDYFDPNDEYSHSKWLSFMDRRLSIAKDLLIANGVIFINIDENQIGCLIVLCEKMFGEDNVDVLIWPKMDPKYDENRVEKPIKNVKIAHEYVVLCYKDRKNTHFSKMMRRPNHSGFDAREEPVFMETILHEVGTTSSAKDELMKIFGRRDIFATPKPVKMIKEFIRVAAGPEATVLDYFAGSGTTGHAVMELNNEDGGRRKFILVTNNENDICRSITYERLKRIIQMENYKENLRFFHLESQN